MRAGAAVDACGNCGAPLDLDENGACRWCHARVLRQQPAQRLAYYYLDDWDSLVPAQADDCSSSAPFLYLTMTALGSLLSPEPAVQAYVRSQRGLRGQVRALAMAVSAAGVRVRDAGLLKDDFDQNLAVYTPAEIWVFDLALDVVALLGSLPELPGRARAKAASDLLSLEDNARSHAWKDKLRRAGTGPEPFGDLRGRIPRRRPGGDSPATPARGAARWRPWRSRSRPAATG